MSTPTSNSPADVAVVVHEPAPAPSLLRTMIAVVLGFFTFAATLTLGALIVALVSGPEFVYQGDTWRTSIGMDFTVIVFGGIGAFMAGAVCRPIGGTPRIVPIFACALLVTVILWLVMRTSAANPDASRTGGLTDTSGGHTTALLGPLVRYGLPAIAALMAFVGGSIANRVQRALFGR